MKYIFVTSSIQDKFIFCGGHKRPGVVRNVSANLDFKSYCHLRMLNICFILAINVLVLRMSLVQSGKSLDEFQNSSMIQQRYKSIDLTPVLSHNCIREAFRKKTRKIYDDLSKGGWVANSKHDFFSTKNYDIIKGGWVTDFHVICHAMLFVIIR